MRNLVGTGFEQPWFFFDRKICRQKLGDLGKLSGPLTGASCLIPGAEFPPAWPFNSHSQNVEAAKLRSYLWSYGATKLASYQVNRAIASINPSISSGRPRSSIDRFLMPYLLHTAPHLIFWSEIDANPDSWGCVIRPLYLSTFMFATLLPAPVPRHRGRVLSALLAGD